YFAYLGSNGDLTADGDFFVYLRGSNASSGSETSSNWNGTHTLPFAAEYMIGIENSSLGVGSNSQFRKFTGGSWQNQDINNIDLYCGNAGSKVTEFRIGWDRLGGRPSDTLYVVAFHQYEDASNILNAFPLSNPAGGADSVVFTDYYKFTDMSDTMPQSDEKFNKINIAASASIVSSGENFSMTAWVVNSKGDTLQGYKSYVTLTISNGATLHITSVLLNEGKVTFNDSITGVFGNLVCTAALSNNLTKFDTLNLTVIGPLVEIKYPDVTSHDTYIQEITVKGTTLNTKIGDTVIIYANNYSTAYSDTLLVSANGEWNGTVLLTGLGDSVIVKLIDHYGNISYDTLTVNYYSNTLLEINYPSYISHDTNIKEITISGTTASSSIYDTVILYVNGYASANTITLLTSPNGGWSGTVMLTGLGDSVIAKFTDKFGRTVFDTITVNYYGTPDIQITYPTTASCDTTIGLITVSGTTSYTKSGDTIQLYVNNILFASTTVSASGSWSEEVRIASTDTVTVRLTDSFGRTYWDTIYVNLLGRVKNVRYSDRATGGAIDVAWDKVTNQSFAAYKVYYSTSPIYSVDGLTADTDNMINQDDTDYTIYGLTNGTPYYVAVTYKNSAGLEFKNANNYEAEYGAFSGTAEKDDNFSGFSGIGYVAGLGNNAGTTTITVDLGSTEAGNYILHLTGSVGNNAGGINVRVKVNNDITDTPLSTTSFTNWDTAEFAATLTAGANTIKITGLSNSDSPNIDCIKLQRITDVPVTPTGVHSFALTPQSANVNIDEEFNLTIQALDERGQNLTSYTGTLTLEDTTNTMIPDSTATIKILSGDAGSTTVVCVISAIGYDIITGYNGLASGTCAVTVVLTGEYWGGLSVVISEIMFDTSSYGDWIELYNDSHTEVNVGGWYLRSDANGNFASIPSGTIIPPFGYLVLCSDLENFYKSGLDTDVSKVLQISNLNFPNESDTITLFKSATTKHSVLYYNRSFGAAIENSNKSLEAYNPALTGADATWAATNSNFDTTLESYGTPGIANSLSIYNYGLLEGCVSILVNTTAITDPKFAGDTIANISARLILGNGDTIANYKVKFTTSLGQFYFGTGTVGTIAFAGC
nr:lamin tail domain-containing protein [bacterium]